MAVRVRYIVDDVDAAVQFYQDVLGFKVLMQPGPGFAILALDELQLLINKPGGGGGAGLTMPDGQAPTPGGWLRFQIIVPDIDEMYARLSAAGQKFRSGVIIGNGGKQVILEDPSGNPIELFQAG